jgi:hypothetical protein
MRQKYHGLFVGHIGWNVHDEKITAAVAAVGGDGGHQGSFSSDLQSVDEFLVCLRKAHSEAELRFCDEGRAYGLGWSSRSVSPRISRVDTNANLWWGMWDWPRRCPSSVFVIFLFVLIRASVGLSCSVMPTEIRSSRFGCGIARGPRVFARRSECQQDQARVRPVGQPRCEAYE